MDLIGLAIVCAVATENIEKGTSFNGVTSVSPPLPGPGRRTHLLSDPFPPHSPGGGRESSFLLDEKVRENEKSFLLFRRKGRGGIRNQNNFFWRLYITEQVMMIKVVPFCFRLSKKKIK